VIESQNEYGHWVPAEPLEGTFGLRWEFAWRHRRKLGQGWVRSVLGGWRDTRAVDRLASTSAPERSEP
jgi:hypothetical protein